MRPFGELSEDLRFLEYDERRKRFEVSRQKRRAAERRMKDEVHGRAWRVG